MDLKPIKGMDVDLCYIYIYKLLMGGGRLGFHRSRV